MKKEREKKKKFRLFDMNRDGKGVSKEEVDNTPTFKNFFKSFFRKFNKLLSLNLIMLFRLPFYFLVIGTVCYMLSSVNGVFQVVFTYIAMLLGKPVYTVTDPLFGTVSGAYIASGGNAAAANALFDVGNTISMPAFSPLFWGIIIGFAVFSLVTWGWQSVGATYVARGLVRGDPVFIISDYFYAIKKNLLQGFLLGVIDLLIMSLLTFDFLYLYTTNGGIMSEILLFIVAGMLVMYIIMRRYIYLMLITFDIKITKILKNALIFTVLGLKRNLVGGAGSLILMIINLLIGFWALNINFIVPLILPLIYYMATSLYISAYSAYPVIDKYMIAPYKKPEPEEPVEE